MSLSSPQSNGPRLPPLPHALPKTQQDWDRLVNVLQQWRSAITAPKWLSPTLLNGWLYYGAPYDPPGYYRDVSGVVHLRGLVKSGTVGYAAPIFVLPAPYQPAYTSIQAITSNEVFGEVRALAPGDSNGAPGAVVAVVGNNAWFSLSGISFSTTP